MFLFIKISMVIISLHNNNNNDKNKNKLREVCSHFPPGSSLIKIFLALYKTIPHMDLLRQFYLTKSWPILWIYKAMGSQETLLYGSSWIDIRLNSSLNSVLSNSLNCSLNIISLMSSSPRNAFPSLFWITSLSWVFFTTNNHQHTYENPLNNMHRLSAVVFMLRKWEQW